MVSVAQALTLAAEHFQAGRRGEVENVCLKVLEVEPENPQALHLIGVLAHLAGKQGIALALIEKAVRGAPRDAQFRYNLGVVYGVLKRPGAALNEYREAVALNPRHGTAWGNLGNVALELDRFDEAVAAYDEALRVDPRDVNAALARAITLYAARRLEAAGWAFAQALQMAPDQARVHWEHAHLLLMQSEFAGGWDEYEYRFVSPLSNVWHYPYPYPRWSGQALAGKTILLHGEQGLGDEIMFGSIYPEVIAEAGRTIICCQPHVARLFRDSFPTAQVHEQLRADADAWTKRPVEWVQQAPRIDYQIPFGSLARIRRRSAADFPRHQGYLRADPAKIVAWRDKLAHLSGFRVGLCWAANPAIEDPLAARRSRSKSLTLKQLEPLLAADGVDFVSLQTWEAAAQVAAADPRSRERIFDASAGLTDFSETAALIMNLDLVITVDTSVAHAAGALGRPVWILLPWQADWRWHAAGSSTEWYPSATLVRQPALHDWESVIRRVAADLAALAPVAAGKSAEASCA
jgi:tetratricopeptide (TPR) repeat protein